MKSTNLKINETRACALCRVLYYIRISQYNLTILIVSRSYFFCYILMNFTRSIFSIKSILKNIVYRSTHLSLFFFNFHQSFPCQAVDSRRDSDGCYCVWTAPAWLIDWSVNGNDSTEFYAISRTKKTVGPFHWTRSENNAFIEASFMKNEESKIRRIGNSFSIIQFSIIQNFENENLTV